MGRHWNPEDEQLVRALEKREQSRWPEGATAGLVLVAAACLGLGVLLYHLAGPRDVFGS
jgi:hypothetical protein